MLIISFKAAQHLIINALIKILHVVVAVHQRVSKAVSAVLFTWVICFGLPARCLSHSIAAQ